MEGDPGYECSSSRQRARREIKSSSMLAETRIFAVDRFASLRSLKARIAGAYDGSTSNALRKSAIALLLSPKPL